MYIIIIRFYIYSTYTTRFLCEGKSPVQHPQKSWQFVGPCGPQELHQAFSLISKVLRFARAGHGNLPIADQAPPEN